MRLRMTLMAAAAAVGLAGWYATGREQTPPTAAAAAPTLDEGLNGSHGAYAKAYNAGDAKAVAALFTSEAEMTGLDGVTIRGRAAIEKTYADLFKEEPGVRIAIEPGAVRSLGANIAIVTGVSKITHAAGDVEVTLFSALLSKDTEGWKVATVNEYATDPDVGSLGDLAWLAGTWTGKSDDGEMTVTYAWEDNKAFLHCNYKVVKDGKTVALGSQMIGENADGVRAWLFDSSGSTGASQWTKDGNHWTIRNASKHRNGTESGATHLVVKINADTMTWQAIQRVAAGQSLPDSKPMKLTRSK